MKHRIELQNFSPLVNFFAFLESRSAFQVLFVRRWKRPWSKSSFLSRSWIFLRCKNIHSSLRHRRIPLNSRPWSQIKFSSDCQFQLFKGELCEFVSLWSLSDEFFYFCLHNMVLLIKEKVSMNLLRKKALNFVRRFRLCCV